MSYREPTKKKKARKASRGNGSQDVSIDCCRSFLLPLMEYFSPVWGFAAACYMSLLDAVAARNTVLCGEGLTSATVGRLVYSMFYKVWFNKSILHMWRPKLREALCDFIAKPPLLSVDVLFRVRRALCAVVWDCGIITHPVCLMVDSWGHSSLA